MSFYSTDPIVALATSSGNSGIGIIRLSGKDDELKKILLRISDIRDFEPRKAALKCILDKDGSLIDRAIILYFPAPHSYTGETVVEIQAHGGIVLLTWIIELLLDVGKEFDLRLANPGEFTERAFLNGKMDLVQAEAVADIIDASSRSAVKAASLSLKGEFSEKIHRLRDKLIRLRVEVEAILDFPEEEIDFLSEYQCESRTESLLAQLENILDTAEQGETLRDGFRVAIVGQTNVGKSSLLNRLAGEELAIVSDIAGTTRDKIQTTIHLNGIPFYIIDTAGIRETEDVVEKIGIERAKSEISKADIILHIVDARMQEDNDDDKKLISMIESLTDDDIPMFTVKNKSDLCNREDNVSRETLIFTSAKTGKGIEELKTVLLKATGWKNKDSVFIARERHVKSLKEAYAHLKEASEVIKESSAPLEIYAEELRLAGEDLGDIVGQTASDDLLGMIFKGFCIGK